MRIRLAIVPLLALLALAATGPPAHARAADRVPDELIVGWRPGVRAAERAALLEARGARVLHRFRTIDAARLRVDGDPDSAMAALAADPRIAYAEPNAIVRAAVLPSDPRFGEQWSLRNTGQTGGTPGADVDAVAAWDVFTGNPDLRVGVIDSGIDLDHPDLVANLWTNPGEIAGNGLDDDGNGYVDDVHGWDFANGDPDPDDDYGHGTHVAGIIAARADNGVGIAGLAWRARLVAIKFLDSSGSGTTAGAIEAIEYATALGLRITNNSWGGPVYSQALEAAIAAAGAAGQVVVAAAGNRAEDNDAVAHYPSSYDLPNVVSVAATGPTDALASFSNFGATSVDIAAPGVAILSSVPGGGYGLSSGTSMAAPLVAGTLALLLGRSPGLSPERAIDLLYSGAEPVAALQGRIAGARRLNALRAVADPDTVAPGAVAALTALEPGSNSAVLEWIATGDDGAAGRAADYDIRYATAPIDPGNVNTATRVAGPLPAASGTPERFEVAGLAASTTYWFAVRALDEFGNIGPLTATANVTTLGPPRLDAAPAQLTASLVVGARDTLAVSIGNVAEGTLDFTVPSIALMFPPPPSLAASPAPDASAKGEPGAPGPPVAASTGGPDAMGYRWIDSRDPAGPAFDWIDVTADGHRVPLSGDDALSPPLELGFAFPFYGGTVRAVRVSTNGALTFSDAVPGPVNQFLPSPVAPPLIVAPFWDDLLFASIERAWYRAEPGRFVVSWLAVPHYGSGGPYTFQAVLDANGEIRFQYLTMGPATLSATAGLQNADRTIGLTVAHNTAFFRDSLAVRIVPLPQWARANPGSGRVRAGERVDVEVALDARGLLGGAYDATLKILSNDPQEPERVIPIRLLAIGAPDLVAEPAALAFGDVFVGAEAGVPLEIRNPGSEWLHLGRIDSDVPGVATDASLFSIPPRGARTVQVTWAPVAAGEVAGVLRLHSNIGGGSVTEVPLAGRALPPPVLAVEPGALAVALEPQGMATRTLWIRNDGASPLAFTARAQAGGAQAAVARDADPDALRPAAKRAPDRAAGVSADDAGGPDRFGYTWRTSDAADAPAFDWIDATAGGVALTITGDDVTSAPVPLGFDFPFYGGTFDRVRVSTNGWLSFTSGLGAFSNTLLPSGAEGVPENLIAPYWDDFHFGESRLAWIRRDADRAVIEWHEVGRLDDASRPNTFQAVLHADGRIRFQYLRMKGENLSSGTAGIQNGARDDGLTIAYNTVFARDSLAIELTPPARWLEVLPAAGEVGPGAALGLEVRVRPQGRLGGIYPGRIALTSNDPLRAALAVPCTLIVQGAPSLAVPPGGLTLDPAYAGFTRTLETDLVNAGTAAFELIRIVSGHPALAATLDPARIEPGAAGRLRVSLSAASEGAVTTSLTLEAAGGGEVAIPVQANVTAAPRAATSTLRVEAVLANDLGPAALTRTREVVIANDGGSPLTWRAEAMLTGLPALAPAARPLPARGKGVAAPAGAVGPRGPDAAGYHWTDSKSGGAPFDWIDAVGAGTAVALEGDDVASGPIALPFAFPFYDAVHDTVFVSSNGFLSFGGGAADYVHVPLPAPAAPRSIVAPCWADFDLRAIAGAGRVIAATVEGRFVVSFLDVPRFGGGTPASFQVVLGPDGDIDFQYLRAGARAQDATVGIQNGRGDIGLTVAHGAPYLEDGLRVSIRRRPAWLTVAPRAGSIAPGARDTLRVTFTAEGREDGVESGAIRLITGDPARPERILAATLRIGSIPVEVALETARGGSGTPRWVEALIGGAGIGADSLAASRPRLGGAAAIGPGTVYEDGRVGFRFPRLEVLGGTDAGAARVLELAGAVEGAAWIHGADSLRGAGPAGVQAPAAPVRGGESFEVGWIPREGLAVDAHLSLDGGATWRTLAHGVDSGLLRAPAPREGAAAAWLELEGFDALGYAGSAFLGPFEITAGEALPARLALAVAGAVPARAPVAIELALPAAAEVRVDVFDVRGARVATLARGALAAGRHRLEWPGLDRAGRRAPPGIYFARALAGTREARARIVLLR